MRDGRVDVFDSGGGVKNTVTIDTDRHARFRRGCKGALFKGRTLAGELSADSRGSAPPGVSERGGGTMSKVLLRYFRRK